MSEEHITTLSELGTLHDAGGDARDTDRAPPLEKPLCLVGLPHSGSMTPESMSSLTQASETCRVDVVPQGSSLLCHNFNRLWAHALNMVPRPKYFAMHHSDILAPPGWVDLMIAEMEAHDAVMCSAVVAIKDFFGLTSTALMDATDGTIRRVTSHEMALLPKTFDGESLRRLWDVPDEHEIALCVNTGLWVCRFDEWAEGICFETGDSITREAKPGHPRGEEFVARVFPEDWMFSSELAKQGRKVIATQKLSVIHFGRAPFGSGGSNHKSWGSSQTDRWFPL